MDSDSECMAEAQDLVDQAGLDLAMGIQAPHIQPPNQYDDDPDEDDYEFILEETEADGSKRKYEFHVRRIIHLYEQLSDARFKALFRMCRETFDALMTTLGPFIPAGRSNNGKSLLPIEKLLVFLYCMGSNSFVIHSGTNLDVSEGTVFNCVNQVLEACFKSEEGQKHFVDNEIYLPEEAEALDNGREFLKRSKNFPPNFPPMFFGSLDGCHIEVRLKSHSVEKREIHSHLRDIS